MSGRGLLNVDSARLGSSNSVTVATTSTSAASTAFGAQTYQIRVAAPAACFMKMGDPAATPTASTSDAYIPPNFPEYFTVTPGQKVAFFSTTTQTVSVVEVTQ